MEPATDEYFNNEKEFQIWLARRLKQEGFEVYLDKNICELPVFKGDKEKPDILVFYKNFYKDNKTIAFSSPLAIETKFVGEKNGFNAISKSILQTKKYVGKKYFTENWSGEIKNLLLCSDTLMTKNKVYDWCVAQQFSGNDMAFHIGMRWALIRILSTASNQTGILCWDGSHFVIETPNSCFWFLKGGDIGYKPNGWNNEGRG